MEREIFVADCLKVCAAEVDDPAKCDNFSTQSLALARLTKAGNGQKEKWISRVNDVAAFIKKRKKTDAESTDRDDGEDGKALLKIMRETVVKEDDDGRRVAVPKRARYVVQCNVAN